MNTIIFKTKLLKLFCYAVVVLAISACSMQEELFDLAEGSNAIAALGWDGSTVKVITVEPDQDYIRFRDTSVALAPPNGSIKISGNKKIWFLVGGNVYKWDNLDSSPMLSKTLTFPGAFCVFDDGNALVHDVSDIYSSADGWAASLQLITSASSFSSDLAFSSDGGGFLIDYSTYSIYSITSSSCTSYSSAGFTPALSGTIMFFTRVDGEFFVGTTNSLYRDFYTNGTGFLQLATGFSAANTFRLSFAVISHDLQYVAYQTGAGANIVVDRIDNGVITQVATIGETGDAYVSLEHYKGNKLVLGIGGTTSTAKGLYVIDGENKTFRLIDNTCEIYDLCRISE
ncbi:MAG TPA: hypothetical protein PK544_12000 [Spirochaetota bacterium]|nr:hypothetical protein [Spirochaetota bacterium]